MSVGTGCPQGPQTHKEITCSSSCGKSRLRRGRSQEGFLEEVMAKSSEEQDKVRKAATRMAHAWNNMSSEQHTGSFRLMVPLALR